MRPDVAIADAGPDASTDSSPPTRPAPSGCDRGAPRPSGTAWSARPSHAGCATASRGSSADLAEARYSRRCSPPGPARSRPTSPQRLFGVSTGSLAPGFLRSRSRRRTVPPPADRALPRRAPTSIAAPSCHARASRRPTSARTLLDVGRYVGVGRGSTASSRRRGGVHSLRTHLAAAHPAVHTLARAGMASADSGRVLDRARRPGRTSPTASSRCSSRVLLAERGLPTPMLHHQIRAGDGPDRGGRPGLAGPARSPSSCTAPHHREDRAVWEADQVKAVELAARSAGRYLPFTWRNYVRSDGCGWSRRIHQAIRGDSSPFL